MTMTWPGRYMRALCLGRRHLHGPANASALIASAAAIAAGTAVTVVLGPRNGPSRPIDRVALRAGLGMKLQVVRAGHGGLQIVKQPVPLDTRPLRVHGRTGAGLYWSLRAAGVSPQSAAEYLRALASEIDVGSEIGADDRSDPVMASRRAATGERETGPLLYAGVDRFGARDLQLVKWPANGRSSWINAAHFGPAPVQPDDVGRSRPITSASAIASTRSCVRRMHRGIDFGAGSAARSSPLPTPRSPRAAGPRLWPQSGLRSRGAPQRTRI